MAASRCLHCEHLNPGRRMQQTRAAAGPSQNVYFFNTGWMSLGHIPQFGDGIRRYNRGQQPSQSPKIQVAGHARIQVLSGSAVMAEPGKHGADVRSSRYERFVGYSSKKPRTARAGLRSLLSIRLGGTFVCPIVTESACFHALNSLTCQR